MMFSYILFIAWVIPKTRDVSASKSIPVSTNHTAPLRATQQRHEICE